MRRFVIYIIFVLTGLSFQKCNLINPAEEIPAYIHIDSFILTGNYDSVGSLSHKITDVWVTVDNDFIGTFELPATFPVLKSGQHHISVRAGVYDNGISLTRVPYPFYSPYSIDLNLKEKKIDTIRPVIQCITRGVIYEFKEDFEHSISNFRKSSNSTVDFTRTDSSGFVFEGRYSLKATMDTAHKIFEITTNKTYNITRGKSAYLEFNYRSDLAFQVGYYSYDPTGGGIGQVVVINLNPSSTWKKIYADFGVPISYEESYKQFAIFISANKTDSRPSSSLYLDNIKLICFE